MTNKTYNTNKQIPPERWEEFCDSFTLANQDRLLSIEVVGFDIGDQQLANMVPFSAIDFDTPDKGNTFIISYGTEAPLMSHTVSEPAELWLTQDEFESVSAMEIVDVKDRKTIIKFE